MTIDKIIEKSGVKHFVEIIEKQLKSHNGKIIFKNKNIENRDIDGEFSEFDMTITCYIDYSSTYWIGVLAHEYSHFLQCIGGSEYWANFQESALQIDDLDNIFKNKKIKPKITKRKRLKIMSNIIKMELDCDKSAIKLINKYKLPVDKKEYNSKANIVLYKYLYWAEYGHWPSITCKKTNKRTYWEDFKISKLLGEEKYINVDQIPRKLFYTFQEN